MDEDRPKNDQKDVSHDEISKNTNIDDVQDQTFENDSEQLENKVYNEQVDNYEQIVDTNAVDKESYEKEVEARCIIESTIAESTDKEQGRWSIRTERARSRRPRNMLN